MAAVWRMRQEVRPTFPAEATHKNSHGSVEFLCVFVAKIRTFVDVHVAKIGTFVCFHVAKIVTFVDVHVAKIWTPFEHLFGRAQ